MVKQLLLVFATLALISTSLAGSCVNPEIKVKTFTNDDATVLTHIAFITEFSLSCKEGENFYALVGENFLPVTTIGDNQYQVFNIGYVNSFQKYSVLNTFLKYAKFSHKYKISFICIPWKLFMKISGLFCSKFALQINKYFIFFR